jgi:EGF domain-containing protein
MLFPRHFHLLAVSLSAVGVTGCATDEDCSLNGVCVKPCKLPSEAAVGTKVCKCDPGWIGSDCGRLDLAPATRFSGYNYSAPTPLVEGNFNNYTNASWGGTIVQDRANASVFHLFTVQFTHGCGLSGWRPHSYIIRAESHVGPQGPYHYADAVSKNFRHNPHVIYSPGDDKYLMYAIGTDYDKVYDRCESISYTRWPNNISVSAADDVRGPWTPFKMIVDSDRPAGIHATNPSAFPLWTPENPTKEMALLIKDYSIFTADTWDGKYELQYQATWNVSERENPQWTEDPYIWRDKRGNWHSLNHWMIDYVEHDGRRWPRVGSHLFARELTGPWTFKLQEAYSSNVTFTDGSYSVLQRRERPKLFFSDDGEMTPLYLISGVQDMGQSRASYTLVQPIGTKWEEFEEHLGFGRAPKRD